MRLGGKLHVEILLFIVKLSRQHPTTCVQVVGVSVCTDADMLQLYTVDERKRNQPHQVFTVWSFDLLGKTVKLGADIFHIHFQGRKV